VIVLSEATEKLAPSASANDIKRMTDAAQLAGCRIYYIPPDFEQCETAENALYYVPQFDPPVSAVWIGYIPPLERYQAIYEAALAKGVRLINSPAEYQTAIEFDKFYPLPGDLTPPSAIISSVAECAAAGVAIGYPVFVKGTVQSRKSKGWRACVAHNQSELENLTGVLLQLETRSRGLVIVRQLVSLQHERKSGEDFPFGREFRVFSYAGQILEYGYYWEGDDSLSHLSKAEENTVLDLAWEAAHRVNVPYLAVDIGQTEAGEWIVIEVGDGQFAGLSQVSPLKLWHKLNIMLT
jgi:hypothetical protein